MKQSIKTKDDEYKTKRLKKLKVSESVKHVFKIYSSNCAYSSSGGLAACSGNPSGY